MILLKQLQGIHTRNHLRLLDLLENYFGRPKAFCYDLFDTEKLKSQEDLTEKNYSL